MADARNVALGVMSLLCAVTGLPSSPCFAQDTTATARLDCARAISTGDHQRAVRICRELVAQSRDPRNLASLANALNLCGVTSLTDTSSLRGHNHLRVNSPPMRRQSDGYP